MKKLVESDVRKTLVMFGYYGTLARLVCPYDASLSDNMFNSVVINTISSAKGFTNDRVFCDAS